MGSDLAPLIAVVGSDGSGKSTLSADLLAHVQRTRNAESGYLGLACLPDVREQVRRQGRLARPVASDDCDQGSEIAPHFVSSVP